MDWNGSNLRVTGFAVELRLRDGYIMRMPMTLDQIVEEAGRLPTRQVVELVERLSQRAASESGRRGELESRNAPTHCRH